MKYPLFNILFSVHTCKFNTNIQNSLYLVIIQFIRNVSAAYTVKYLHPPLYNMVCNNIQKYTLCVLNKIVTFQFINFKKKKTQTYLFLKIILYSCQQPQYMYASLYDVLNRIYMCVAIAYVRSYTFLIIFFFLYKISLFFGA